MDDLYRVLTNVQAADPELRNRAETTLEQFAETDFSQFWYLLMGVLLDESNGNAQVQSARQIAGILLKNTLGTGTGDSNKQIELRWKTNLPETQRENLKNSLLQALSTANATLPITLMIAQIVSKIARIELEQGWPELFAYLDFTANATILQYVNGMVLATYILEDIVQASEDLEIDILSSDDKLYFLRYVVNGIGHTDDRLILQSLKAIYPGIIISGGIIQNANDVRNVLGSINAHILSKVITIRLAAWEALLQTAEVYYDHYDKFITDYAALTFHTLAIGEQQVTLSTETRQSIAALIGEFQDETRYLQADEIDTLKLSAIEFWSAICDEEKYRKSQGNSLHGIIEGFYAALVPILLELTVSKESEPLEAEDDWTVAKAAGSCLLLVSEIIGDPMVPICWNYICTNWASTEWQRAESATFVYGAMLIGCSPTGPAEFVASTIEQVIERLSHELPILRDTSAWAIGVAATTSMSSLRNYLKCTNNRTGILKHLLNRSDEEPHVVRHVLDCLYNILNGFGDTYSKVFLDLVELFNVIAANLIHISQRADGDEYQIRAKAYDCMYILVNKTPKTGEVSICISQMLRKVIKNLGEITERPYTESLGQLQASVVGCVITLIATCSEDQIESKREIINLLAKILTSGSEFNQAKNVVTKWSMAAEEVFLLFETLIGVLQEKIAPELQLIVDFMFVALRSVEYDSLICVQACELVGTCVRNAPYGFAPYVQDSIQYLGALIVQTSVSKTFKPLCISMIGEIGMLYPVVFAQHLPTYLNILNMAAETTVIDSSSDSSWEEYVDLLTDATFSGYSTAFYTIDDLSMKDSMSAAIGTSIQSAIRLAYRHLQSSSNEQVLIGALGLTYDLCKVFGTSMNEYSTDLTSLKNLILYHKHEAVIRNRNAALSRLKKSGL